METEKEQGDVEKYFAALLVEGDIFEGIQRGGAKFVYDLGGMWSRAIVLGCTRGIETPVVDVEDVVRAEGIVVDAESHQFAEPEEEQQVEIGDVFPRGIEVFHGIPDVLEQCLVRVGMPQHEVEDFAPQQGDVHLVHVKIDGGRVHEGRYAFQFVKSAPLVGVIFDLDDLHTLHGVVTLPLEERHGGDKLHIPPFRRVGVHDLLLLGVRKAFQYDRFDRLHREVFTVRSGTGIISVRLVPGG